MREGYAKELAMAGDSDDSEEEGALERWLLLVPESPPAEKAKKKAAEAPSAAAANEASKKARKGKEGSTAQCSSENADHQKPAGRDVPLQTLKPAQPSKPEAADGGGNGCGTAKSRTQGCELCGHEIRLDEDELITHGTGYKCSDAAECHGRAEERKRLLKEAPTGMHNRAKRQRK